jgi:hypothetical protein
MIKNDFFVSCFYSNYVRTVRIDQNGQDRQDQSERSEPSGSVRTVSIDQNGQDRQDGTGPVLIDPHGSDRSWPILKVLTIFLTKNLKDSLINNLFILKSLFSFNLLLK